MAVFTIYNRNEPLLDMDFPGTPGFSFQVVAAVVQGTFSRR